MCSIGDDGSADFDALADAQGLWRLLVARPVGGELAPAVAVEVFRRVHNGETQGAADSALLLCTDWRWRRTSAKVLAGMLTADILDDADQDRLAADLLWSDTVHYKHPLGWIGSTFVELDFDPSRGQRQPRQRRVHLDPSTPVTAERHVRPPLRSWAAERLLTRNLADPGAVLEHARSLPARDGAAVVTGAVHSADGLNPPQPRTVVDHALEWGHKAPRKAALELLTEWGEAERAQTLAANDPDASIRAWGRKLHTDVATQYSLFD